LAAAEFSTEVGNPNQLLQDRFLTLCRRQSNPVGGRGNEQGTKRTAQIFIIPPWRRLLGEVSSQLCRFFIFDIQKFLMSKS